MYVVLHRVHIVQHVLSRGYCAVITDIRFHSYASNASTKVTKTGRTISRDNDLSQGFKEVMYKVSFEW